MTAQEYNECVHLWSDGLYRFAYKNVGSQPDAQDAVQQAYEALWMQKEKVIREKGKSFLFTIVYRRCMDKHRHRKQVEGHTEELSIPSTTNYNHYEWKEYLQKALEKLDERSRSLVLLKDLEGYKYEEIAEIAKLSVEQVKVYLHRARKKLKDYVSPKINSLNHD